MQKQYFKILLIYYISYIRFINYFYQSITSICNKNKRVEILNGDFFSAAWDSERYNFENFWG